MSTLRSSGAFAQQLMLHSCLFWHFKTAANIRIIGRPLKKVISAACVSVPCEVIQHYQDIPTSKNEQTLIQLMILP